MKVKQKTPDKVIRVQDVVATVWLNPAMVDGKEVTIPSVTLHRTYMVGQEYKATHTFSRKHLPLIKQVIEEVEEYFQAGNKKK